MSENIEQAGPRSFLTTAEELVKRKAEREEINPIRCDWTPLNDRVILWRLPEEENETDSGITIEQVEGGVKPNLGVVISVGEGMIVGNTLYPMNLEEGDVVRFTRYGGQDETLDGEEYVIVRYAEIVAKAKQRKLVVSAHG
jgi:chaperonin GroES